MKIRRSEPQNHSRPHFLGNLSQMMAVTTRNHPWRADKCLNDSWFILSPCSTSNLGLRRIAMLSQPLPVFVGDVWFGFTNPLRQKDLDSFTPVLVALDWDYYIMILTKIPIHFPRVRPILNSHKKPVRKRGRAHPLGCKVPVLMCLTRW